MQESFWHKFGQNLLSGCWVIVIFMFCAIFSYAKWQPSWNAKSQKIKTASHKKHSGTKLVSTYGSWDIVIFVFMLFLVMAPEGLLGQSICINLKQFHLNKNSVECYVAPALCLHIRNSMKASVWHIFWQNPLGSSWDIVCFIFSLFFVMAEAAILEKVT